MQIVIEPYQNHLRKGRKAIMVDGVRWGVIEMDSHGVHGASYWFRQEGGEAIYEACKNFRGEDSARMVKVWGDKHHRNDNGGAKPFPERLAETVESLIDRKLLRHPDIVRALSAEAHRQETEERRKAEEAEQLEWLGQAEDCLTLLLAKNGMFPEYSLTVNRIIKAMKWAQSR